MANLRIIKGQKFALLALKNIYADLPEEHRLSDGTWVLNKVPFDIEAIWTQWIGSLRADQIRGSNLVLLRALNSMNPAIAGDREQLDLTSHLIKLFSMVQLGGIAEYAEADIVAGSVLDEGPTVRHMGRLPKFHHTKGYIRQPVDLARLEEAVAIHLGLEQVEKMLPAKFSRFMRGLNVLKDGLLQATAQERLHQFVRALEALILPDARSTGRQFAYRCQTFATANAAAYTALKEAYDMRSDAEHLQDWNRALQSHAANDREDVAFQRTRQMEQLALFAYSRILRESGLWPHFEDDAVQEAFWQLTETPRKTIWGGQFDLASVALVQKYDLYDRAA
jgi:hypothetical protein